MRPYELVVVFGNQIEEDEVVDGHLKKIVDVIAENGGEVTGVDKWGKRRLAYELDGNTEGYYAVIDFSAEEETTRALEHSLKLTDDILRHLLVRKLEVDVATADAASS